MNGQRDSKRSEPLGFGANTHGGNGASVLCELGVDPKQLLDLSQSINPFAPSFLDLVIQALSSGALNRYPSEIERTLATKELSVLLGVTCHRVLLTNGGAEAIALVAEDLGRGYVEGPEFSLYERYLPIFDRSGARFRSDPCNPTGLLAEKSNEVENDQVVVWDEAFYPLSTGAWRAPGRDNSIVVGSLTKTFGCPGLRLGYVISPLTTNGLITRLKKRQVQWSVSTPALVSVPGLAEREDLKSWARKISINKSALIDVLSVHGWKTRASDAPWVLVDDAEDLWMGLAIKGIVTRDCTSFGMSNVVRIAVPGDSNLERFATCLAQIDRPSTVGVLACGGKK